MIGANLTAANLALANLFDAQMADANMVRTVMNGAIGPHGKRIGVPNTSKAKEKKAWWKIWG